MHPQVIDTEKLSLSVFSEVFDQPGVLSLHFDPDGRVLEAGANWANRLGHGETSVEPANLLDAVSPSSRVQVEGILQRLRAGETVVGAVLSFTSKHGTPYNATGMLSPVMEGDRMVSAHGVFREKGVGPHDPVISSHQVLDPLLLGALVEFAPDGMMITDEHQEIIAFNSSFLELWGLDASIVWSGNARAAAVRIIKDQDAFYQSLTELYADPEKSGTGVLHLTDERVLDWYSAGTWDEDGKYIGRAWYYRDSTSRIRMEEEIKRSEALYRQLAATFPVGAVFIYDSDLKFLLAEGSGLSDVGMSKERIEGQRLDDVLPRRLSRSLAPIFLDGLNGTYRREDIRFYNRTFSVTTVAAEFGDAFAGRHGMAIAQDISDRKDLEDRLSGAEARLRTLVEQIPVITYVQHVQDSGNKTIFISPQVESMFGYTVSELMDGSVEWLETIHPDDRLLVLSGTESANDSSTGFAMEYRSLTRDGDIRWVRDEATIIRDEMGQTQFWQGIITDITDERKLQNALSESEALFRSAFDDAATGLVLVSLESNMKRINKAFAEMVGYTEQELAEIGSVRNITHPDDVERDTAQFQELMNGDVENYQLIKRFVHRNGNIVWAEMNISFARNDHGVPTHVVSQVQDITEKRRLEEDLRKSEAIFRSGFDNAAIGKALVSPDGRWVEVNRSLCQMLGYSREELLEIDFQQVTHPEDLEEDLGLVQQMLDGTIETYTIEKRYFHKNGDIVWGELRVSLVREENGEPLFFISQIQDVSQKKQFEARLQHLALYDGLTGILNRHGLTQELEASAGSPDETVAVLMLDMDGFKQVNDTFGHDAGDQVLVDSAARIQSCLRRRDIVARLGGDEFVVVLHRTSKVEHARRAASRIREAVEKPIVLEMNGEAVNVGVSIGIEVGRRGVAVSELLRRADQAMYEQKQLRKGRLR